MDDKPAKPKRSYLSKPKRREMLLDSAAEIVESEGWSALNMMSLAERAQVTRQLVYQHFDGLQALLSKTAWHIFQSTMTQTRDSIAAAPDDIRTATRLAEAVTLDLPYGRAQALWELIAGSAGAGEELQQVRRGIRKVIEDLWLEPMQQVTGWPADEARAAGWMLVMAFWGMRQRVVDGEMSRDEGLAAFEKLVERLL